MIASCYEYKFTLIFCVPHPQRALCLFRMGSYVYAHPNEGIPLSLLRHLYACVSVAVCEWFCERENERKRTGCFSAITQNEQAAGGMEHVSMKK